MRLPGSVAGIVVAVVLISAVVWLGRYAMILKGVEIGRGSIVAAGAVVTYREIPDLSHTYPRELNAQILDWMDQKAAAG